MEVSPRYSEIDFIDPMVQLNAGIWSLYVGATAFLIARLYSKRSRNHRLWYDDYILLFAWTILSANNILITIEYATGFVAPKWNDRMHIMIIISSCGTLLGQSLTKTAFAVTLLKLTRGFSRWRLCHGVLWFCIVSMNAYNLVKILIEWGKVCDNDGYDQWYRIELCLNTAPRNKFKEVGNYYNIAMDFVFASFPWIITYNMDLKRREKIGLCLTMSLGMVVAIESTIRNEWKYGGNDKDRWYFWRLAMSNIWYNSEVSGTIIVQCVPVLRPVVQDICISLRSKRLGSSHDGIALEDVQFYHARGHVGWDVNGS